MSHPVDTESRPGKPGAIIGAPGESAQQRAGVCHTFGVWLLDEQLTLRIMAGMVVILFGTGLTTGLIPGVFRSTKNTP